MVEEEKKRYRLEIEGLRALAAVLVAVYHIWFNRVSGGVDVFFVVSGFLITTSILSMYRRNGKILIFSYIVKLLKRLIPTAWTIALITFVAGLFILPALLKEQLYNEVIASLFYFENWRLAWDAVDYLAQNNEASPFQHFWALSIQFQFYLIWLILFFISYLIMKAFKKRTIQPIIFGFIVFVVIGSFSYSVYFTDVNQPVAYYHTFTRIWEFGVGGILAFMLHRVELSNRVSFFAGWLGVIGLLLVGIVLQVSTVFPGYAALWPVLSAVLILFAGNNGGRFSAYRLLSSKPLVSFGQISYAFYLWHWPLLIFYYALTERTEATFFGGLSILIIATALSYITIYGIERPLRHVQLKRSVTAFIILTMSVVLFGTIQWMKNDNFNGGQLEVSSSHPGASVALLNKVPSFDEPPIPSLDVAAADRSNIYEDHCINMDVDLDAMNCYYGETENYDATIALVGGSHSAHWQPMLDEIGKANNIRIQTYLKGRCRFSTTDVLGWTPCETWMGNVLNALENNPPDVVFTVGDISVTDYQKVPEGYIEAWERLERANIPLILMRDTPRYPEHVVKCLDANDGNVDACKVKRSDTLLDVGAMEQIELPSNVVKTLDVTDIFCDEDDCYPVVGNMVTHFDKNHITATFSRSFAPVLEKDILEAVRAAKKYRAQ